MPRVIPAETGVAAGATLELGALIERLERERFDPRDEECFAVFAEPLRQLANDRDFLVDIIIDELKQRCATQSYTNRYGPQVVMLHRSKHFAIRANMWPALDDAVMEGNDRRSFFYDVPHDHNFSFLTAGYFGPGYWSDYYEYDYDAVLGVPGEPVALRFAERSRLAEGKVMLYRAHRDVHAQRPPDALSVSLNIMEQSTTLPYRDQYRFDTDRLRLAAVLTQAPIEPLLALAAQIGGGNARDLVERFAASHPSDRIRFSALSALARAHPDQPSRADVFARGATNPNRYIAAMSSLRLQQMEAVAASPSPRMQ